MRIRRIEEFKINPRQHAQISQLLQQCFSTYPPDRSYYKQIPTFRLLVFDNSSSSSKNKLIAHLGVIHRMIAISDMPASIFGVADLCVHPDFQKRKIASELLNELENLGKKHGVDFILLMADVQRFYQKNGYKIYKNPCKWLMINNHQTLGVTKRKVEDSLMAKPLGDKLWKDGVVDFLGYMF